MKKILVLIVLLCLLALFGFSKDSSHKKFQLEVISGLPTLNPEDLNANANIFKQIVKFWYEDRYDYYKKVEYIQSYETKKGGKFRTIKTALPLGLWFKYFVFQPLALSLGVKYFARRAKSNFSHTTTISENDGTQVLYRREYSPFTLSAEAFISFLEIEKRFLLYTLGVAAYNLIEFFLLLFHLNV
jgi:hypothetical protein